MTKTYNWGIIGPGKIAHKFAQGLQDVSNGKLYAVASRSQERANKFKNEYGATHAYNSYKTLVEDKNIDVIYIATTNNLHYEHAKLCLENGKACLVEKPFTLSSIQLQELIDIAKKNNVFLMEALWTRFLPSISTIEKQVKANAIGTISHVEADFGFKVDYNEESRLFSPELGGGAIWDIGIYPIFFALHFLGATSKIQSKVIKTELGIDIEEEIKITHNNGTYSKLKSSFAQDLPCEAIIYGDKGSLKLERMWHCPTKITLTTQESVLDITPKYHSNGYNYEIEEVQNCLQNGEKESNKFPLHTSLELLQTLEKVISSWE